MSKPLVDTIDELLGAKDDMRLRQVLLRHNFHAIGEAINNLHRGKRKVFSLLPPEIQSEVAIILTDASKHSIYPRLSDDIIARFLHFNDEDDAVDILQFLAEERRQSILERVKIDKRMKFEKLLRFGKETAGGLMDLNFILVKPDFTLKDVAEKVQKHLETEKQAPLVLVVNEQGQSMGYIPYKDLILTPPTTRVSALIQSLPVISHKVDQEKILSRIPKRGDVIGVTDDENHVLGIIHLRDLLKVAQKEATEDIYLLAGVDLEEEMNDDVSVKVKRRVNWLIINLGTAFLASFVVAQFESTIARLSILAVYMPIVAGEGGNAATQALAVVVRGLALGEVSWDQARSVILKETTAGIVNGVVTGIIAGVVAYAFGGPPMLGIVLASAMIINLMVAGFFGTLVPFLLRAFRIDPATASTVFVTTATDVFGFLAFLGLGSLML
jgi:magnesium transporter